MPDPSDAVRQSRPLYDRRLAIESEALRQALRRFIAAQGAVPDETSDGFVDRAVYQHERTFQGLVVLKGQFPRCEVVYLTVPGLFSGAEHRPSLEALVARIAQHHATELIHKDVLQAYAVDAGDALRRIQVRPGRPGRTEHRRRLKEERRLKEIRREWFGRDSWAPRR